MKKQTFFSVILLGLLALNSWSLLANDELPTKANLQEQIKTVEASEENLETKNILLTNLRETVVLLDKIDEQKNAITTLKKSIDEADSLTEKSQQEMNRIHQEEASFDKDIQKWEGLTLDELIVIQKSQEVELQAIQDELARINGITAGNRFSSENIQKQLSDNLTRAQQLNKWMFSAQVSPSLRNKYQVELQFLELSNQYHQLALSGGAKIIALYDSQVALQRAKQKQLQDLQSALLQKINQRRLTQSQQQLEKFEKANDSVASENPILRKELTINAQLSQQLLKETDNSNQLVQDGLRIRNMLDSLLQTQRNLEQQISALEGTLALSQVINRQRQALPTDGLIQNLSKRITDLRVAIFDLNQQRDQIFNPTLYVNDLIQESMTTFSNDEKTQLIKIIQDRRQLFTDTITQLNEQLNNAINIDLNQQQVIAISSSLQSQLQQKSFWVRSNNPVGKEWLNSLPVMIKKQAEQIITFLGIGDWRSYFLPILFIVAMLLLSTGFIFWRKSWIKERISIHNKQVNTLTKDNQWHTPIVLFYTLVLALPVTLLFCAGLLIITFLLFKTPIPMMPWAFEMMLCCFFFVASLGLLRPNGMSHKHFNLSQHSTELFRKTLISSIPIMVVLLNASVFTKLDQTGVTNDYIGSILLVVALVWFIFKTRPGFKKAIQKLHQDIQTQSNDDENLSKTQFTGILNFLSLVIPVGLIGLVLLGYYYTALVLVKYIIYSYLVIAVWFYVREVVHRAIRVSSRKLAYQRIKEKQEQERLQREQQTENQSNSNDVVSNEFSYAIQEEKMDLTAINLQIKKLSSIGLWLLLAGLLYWVWSDLIGVAYYLNSIALWQQNSIDLDGNNIVESVTLLNLIGAIIIFWGIYLIIRNLGGVLEIFVFSKVRLSQGTPYAITTILSYLIVAIGAGAAFSYLGFSWGKLQWLFAALSVGLGFGLQEIFANFVSGIIILFERPIRIGDIITVGEFSGTVSKIRIRATTLIDFDGKEVIVPNKTFVIERLTNWSLSNTMTRVVLKVGVAYGSDLELTRRLLLQAADEAPFVLKDPEPLVFFLTIAASTFDHELRVYVSEIMHRNPTIDFLNRRIDELFKQNNIDMAFNQLDIFIKNKEIMSENKIQ